MPKLTLAFALTLFVALAAPSSASAKDVLTTSAECRKVFKSKKGIGKCEFCVVGRGGHYVKTPAPPNAKRVSRWKCQVPYEVPVEPE